MIEPALLRAQQSDSVQRDSAAVQAGGVSDNVSMSPGPAAQQPAGLLQQDAKQSSNNGTKTDGSISGTVTDNNGALVQGATVVLDGSTPSDHRELVTGDNGQFTFDGLKPGIGYRVSVFGDGFSSWSSPAIVLEPGQYRFLPEIILRIETNQTSVTVNASTEQIATEQVRIEEQQRVLGFIPNFYVVYDSKNAVPLTPKLKFKLALRVSVDPVTVGGVALMSGIYQAADTPNFVQGAKGYGQRFGTIAADGASGILIGGAILPSLLHQDPRYFYQGTGTTKSRAMHAILSPFICKGDNGRWQPNYSSLGGDLASSAISNAYYPESNRGAGMVFGGFAIGTAERMASGFAQEFILPRLTPSVRKQRSVEKGDSEN
jgi:hypothetical protein